MLSVCIKQNNHRAIYTTLLSGGALELFVVLFAMILPVVGGLFITPLIFSLIMIIVAFWYKNKFYDSGNKKW